MHTMWNNFITDLLNTSSPQILSILYSNSLYDYFLCSFEIVWLLAMLINTPTSQVKKRVKTKKKEKQKLSIFLLLEVLWTPPSCPHVLSSSLCKPHYLLWFFKVCSFCKWTLASKRGCPWLADGAHDQGMIL